MLLNNVHADEKTRVSCAEWKKMAEDMPRFTLLEGTVDDFIDDQENKNTRAKTDRDIILLKAFLQTNVDKNTAC